MSTERGNVSGDAEPNEPDEDTGRLFGRQRKPRTLIMTRDDQFAKDVAALVPTSGRVSFWGKVEQTEWDLLVTTEEYVTNSTYRPDREPRPDMYIISFVTGHVGGAAAESPYGGSGLMFGSLSRSTEYVIPSKVFPEFESLVESSLLPAVQRREEGHPVLYHPSKQAQIYPLLSTGLGETLAAVWLRHEGSPALALPEDTPDQAAWVKAALKLFRRLDHETFQQIPGWEELPAWSTAPERRLRGHLGTLERERLQTERYFSRRDTRLRDQLAVATVDAESGLRRLLTSQRNELVGAVTDALAVLGFEVTSVDDLPGMENVNLAEDLRLTDPDHEGWVCLVEVKGYTKGAKATDLTQLVRHENRFQITQGGAPSAVWYLVNQFAGQDPEVRPSMLASQDDELRAWAKDTNGLALDTADLFRLVVAVEEGVLLAVEARRRLREARVRTSFEELTAADTEG